MLKKIVCIIVAACAAGVILGFGSAMLQIIEIDTFEYIMFAGVYLIMSIIFSILYLKWYILFAVFVVYMMVQIIKMRAGCCDRRN